jgi:hypothetical protein
MSTVMLELLPMNDGPPTVLEHVRFAATAAQHDTSSFTMIAIVCGIVAFVALAGLLRRILAVATHLLRSAGAAVAVLITLLGAGTVVLTTVVMYVVDH